MIHLLGKEYGWSKSQIDEVYPQEATILLKIVAFEKRDDLLRKKLDYYLSNIDKLFIAHGDPEAVRDKFVAIVEKLQGAQIELVSDLSNSSTVHDDDLPDFAKLSELKKFKQTHRR